MPKNILLATLGTTPAVVTEALDLLTEQRVGVDEVRLVTTQDSDVQGAYRLLCKHLESHEKTRVVEVPTAELEDISNSEGAVDFLEIVCDELKQGRDRGNRIYVCIAGGRKAMAALLALAVQFYGAERLFHIWVPPWVEEKGGVGTLRRLADDDLLSRLHPSFAESERPRLVDLPFIGLFPLLPDILAALRGKVAPSLRKLLESNGLLLPSGKPTELGQRVGQVLERVESLPPARNAPPEVHIQPDHHYASELRRFAQQLTDEFPFITRAQSIPWSSGEGKVKLKEGWIEVLVPLGSGPRLGLRVESTAATKGQWEAARRAMERFVQAQRLR